MTTTTMDLPLRSDRRAEKLSVEAKVKNFRKKHRFSLAVVAVLIAVTAVWFGARAMFYHGKVVAQAKGVVSEIGYVKNTGSLTLTGGPYKASNPYKNYYYVMLMDNMSVKNNLVTYTQSLCFMPKAEALKYQVGTNTQITKCLISPSYWSMDDPNMLDAVPVKKHDFVPKDQDVKNTVITSH